jgi:hypothetical protein
MSKRRITVWIFVLVVIALTLATVTIYSKRRDVLTSTLTKRLTAQSWTDLNLEIAEVGKEQLEIRTLALRRTFGDRSVSISVKNATINYTPRGLLDGRVTKVFLPEGTIEILDSTPPTEEPKRATPLDLSSILSSLAQLSLDEVSTQDLNLRWQKGTEIVSAKIAGTARKDAVDLTLELTGDITASDLSYSQLTVPKLAASSTKPLILRFAFDKKQLEQLTAEFALTSPAVSWGAKAIQMEKVTTKLAVAAATDIRDTRFTLRDTSAELFGGTLRLPESTLSLNDKQHQLTLKLEALDLAQILSLYRQEKIAVTGTIDGSLPISFGENGVSVKNGDVATRTPGGTISYSGPAEEVLGDVKENPDIALVAQALRNFRYSVLNANVAYGASGDLALQVQSSGTNPDVINGREINLNINLEDNIPKLLKSLSVGSDLAGKLESEFQQKLQKGK